MKLKILTALLLAIGFTLVACGGANNAPAKGGETECAGDECAPADDSTEEGEAPDGAESYMIGIDGMT